MRPIHPHHTLGRLRRSAATMALLGLLIPQLAIANPLGPQVVSGQASIKLRRIGTDKVIEYRVSGDKPSWVEMPIYHTHNITNVGKSELVTLFWINEHFDPSDPDTFFEEV